MKSLLILALLLAACVGCSGGDSTPAQEAAQVPAAFDRWLATPEDVIKGVMHAYETRNDSLYASLLAEEFTYQFEPPGAGPEDILSWGREEEVMATGSLFQTPELESVTLSLDYAEAQQVSDARVMIPVSGGELRLDVKEKDATLVTLNRQEIFLSPHPSDKGRWQIVAWHDYPSPE